MKSLSYKTVSANKTTTKKSWVLVNADGQNLGRLASRIAIILRGKHKTNFTPHIDCGDNVIVINAEKISLTGKKWDQKKYIRHTGYPGGQRSLSAKELFDKSPVRLIEKSVKGMLPKNKLGASLYRNLHVNLGEEFSQKAQKPKLINLTDIN